MAAEPGRRDGEAGFTLVEMLVSLALSALLAVLLVQAIQATGVINRTSRRLEAQGEVELVREHLRQALANYAGRRSSGRFAPFLGLPDRFVATIQADRDASRLSEVRLDVGMIASDGGYALVETSTAGDVPGRPELLLGRVTGLKLSYFGSQGQDPTPRWAPAWTPGGRPPALIEVTVNFPPSDGRIWLPLVLAVGSGT